MEGGGERTWKRCEERSGENWREPDARKGKEGEGSGGKHEGTRAERSVEEPVSDRGENWRELERTGRKEGEGKGRKGKEAENAKGGETPLEREDERSGENRTQGRGRKRSATKGLSEASNRSIRSLRSLPGETRALGPGGHPDPAEYAGGEAPPCAEPPAAPTCTAKYVIGPPSQHYNHCGASRSLRTDFKERENRHQSRGPIMSSARTQWVNCSSLRRPSSSAL